MKIRIKVEDETSTEIENETAQGNISMVMMTALLYVAQKDIFPGFQKFAAGISESDPAQPEVAAWWARMDPDKLEWLATKVVWA
jgi:hypothetical protein